MTKNRNIIIGIIIAIIALGGGAFYYSNVHLSREDGQGPAIPNEYPSQEVADLEAHIRENPEDSRPFFLLAYEYQTLGNYERSLYLYDKYLELEPGDTIALLNKGTIYLDQQDFENAEKTYLESLDHNFKDMKAYRNLIDVYAYTDNKEGLKSLVPDLRSIESDTGFNIGGETAQAISLLARTYKLLGEYDNAINYYQKMIDLDIAASRQGVEEQIQDLIDKRDSQ